MPEGAVDCPICGITVQDYDTGGQYRLRRNDDFAFSESIVLDREPPAISRQFNGLRGPTIHATASPHTRRDVFMLLTIRFGLYSAMSACKRGIAVLKSRSASSFGAERAQVCLSAV